MTRSAQPAPMVRESALRKNGPCSMTIGVACVDRFELGCRWDGDRDCDDEEDEGEEGVEEASLLREEVACCFASVDAAFPSICDPRLLFIAGDELKRNEICRTTPSYESMFS